MATELTAFVREVVLPGGPDAVPHIVVQACAFRLEYRPSPIHRWGIFAVEPIPARRRVIWIHRGTYQSPRDAAAQRAPENLHLLGQPAGGHRGAIGGSGAEFINHSCAPNLIARTRHGRIHFVSLRPIAAGEELLLDYKVGGDTPLIPCNCGSPQCRGFLNRTDDRG